MQDNKNRRDFLAQLGVTAAGLVAAGYTSTARGYAANDTLNIGAIGTGGRCRQLMQAANKIDGVRITAVCDIWDRHLAEGLKLAQPGAKTYSDFHELLADKDIDAVIIGSPDHWHVPMTIAACQAGKDVYVEKPVTHDISEGPALIEAQNNNQRIVQVGTQQRSMPQFHKAKELIDAGALGDIFKVHMTWNRNQARWDRGKGDIAPESVDWKKFLGNAPDQPFDSYRFRNWRWFWDFGGGIFTDLMVHYIDVAYYLLNLDHPDTAASIGDQFRAKDLWETPDTVQSILEFPRQHVQAYFEGTFVNARNRAMIEIMGTEGTIYLDRGRMEVHPDAGTKLTASEFVPGTGARGADFDPSVDGELLHVTNWIECVRSRNKPNCPAEAGVASAAAAHLSNKALRSGQVAKWEG